MPAREKNPWLVRLMTVFLLVFVGKGIGYPYFHLAGEAFLPIGRRVLQYDGMVVYLDGVPHLCIEAFLSSVQRIGSVVDSDAGFLAVQLEASSGNAVAVAADEGGEIRFRGADDVLDVVVSLYDVRQIAVSVGNHDGDDGPAVVGDGNFVAPGVSEYVEVGLPAVYRGLEILFPHAADILRLFAVYHDVLFLVTFQ